MAEQGVKVDIKVIEAKLDKNEKLTSEEEKFLMENQTPPEGFKDQGTVAPAEKEESTEQTPEEKQTAEKVAADQKAKEALNTRAKAAGLPETATEEEIKAAEKKKEEEADENDPFVKVERLLQKPEEQVTEEDLKDYSKRERAYYYQMRRDRKGRQQAEADRDAARFELSKLKKEKPAEEPKEEEDPFKGKEPTDFLTVADAQKILAKSQKKEESPKGGSFTELPFVQSFLRVCDKDAAALKPDYEEVMELTEEIINTNPAYQKQVAEAFIGGANPALKMYELIQADPEYAKLFPAAQTRVKARKAKKPEETKEKPKAKTPEELKKEKDATAAQEALEKNKDKDKTSGHAEGKDKIEGTDYTIEQITAMSDRDFSKLPKKVREKYLELYG
jgi:hypothetical protein